MRKLDVQRASLLTLCAVQALFIWLTESYPAHAEGTKITAVLRTAEGMKFHQSLAPRRLMHDVLLQEFAKSGNIHIVNKENAPLPVHYFRVPYFVGANLVAFELSETSPTQVSISIALVSDRTKLVVVMENKSLTIPKADVDSSLKLNDKEFDNSNYGKALKNLTREVAKGFEEKVMQAKPD